MVCRPGHEKDPVERIRHSAAHVMASAVQELFPGTKVTIGPVIEGGFYYDFDCPETFTPEGLKKIEQKMGEQIERDLPFVKKTMGRQEAIQFFKDRKEGYKVEIIEGIPEGEEITCYQHGDWVDLCKGPHVRSTGEIKAFKLLSVAGAYWRGDEKNKMLQRIYGTAFESQAALETHLKNLEEAAKRDHRKLGRELDLFSLLDERGPGLVLWHPKGALVRSLIEDFWREQHRRAGYDFIFTPHIAKRDLWKTSGHLDYYKDYMFEPMIEETQQYQLKPMNCPLHIQIYQSRRRSYRELPLRWAELGTVYRYEKPGVLHGLLRVRGFTQDDAHLFCRRGQLAQEIGGVLKLTRDVLSAFGFREYEVFLSTRPARRVGSDSDWDLAEAALRQALEAEGMRYELDVGEGVFYGPKIDLKVKDTLGRSWQCSTVQVDFNLPERFALDYVGPLGSFETPIMIHRALFGSLERFFGVLIEQYAGAFPVWLAPVQVRVLPVTDGVLEYAGSVVKTLRDMGFRVELDEEGDKLGAMIRRAEIAKVPYMLIVGNKEKEAGSVSVRHRGKGDLGSRSLGEFIERVKGDVAERVLE